MVHVRDTKCGHIDIEEKISTVFFPYVVMHTYMSLCSYYVNYSLLCSLHLVTLKHQREMLSTFA